MSSNSVQSLDAELSAAEAGSLAPERQCSQGCEEPSSPALIPAFKPTCPSRSSFQLQAWSAHLGGAPPGHASDGASTGGGSVAGGAPPAQMLSAWQRAWCRVAGTATAAAAAAPTWLPGRQRVCRTRSMEVLDPGREPSAPYLPRKQPLWHRQSQRQQQGQQQGQPGGAAGQSLARLRWRRACRAVLDARTAARSIDLLSNRLAPAGDRLYAAVQFKTRLAAYAEQDQQALACALLAQRGKGNLPCTEHMLNELFITGEHIVGFFQPPPMNRHRPYFTCALMLVLLLVFFYMAGQYGQYQALVAPATTTCLKALQQNGTAVWGPSTMVRWISPRKSEWCYTSPPGKFDAQFLIRWGARWAPEMRSSPERWFTSTLLHQSFMHLLSNGLLLVGLGGQMEIKYGTWRIAVLAVLSALGGNLFSAVTEPACTAVVGASGVVFGMAAVTIADMVHNFETLTRPLLRTAVLLAFLVFFAVTVGTTVTGTSHFSHVGGFVCGLLPALVLLPNLHRGRVEMVVTVAALVGCLVIFVTLPVVFYVQQLPRVCCSC